MSTATRVIRDDIPNFMGNWGPEFQPRLYRLDPALDGYEYVAVLVLDLPEIEIEGTNLGSGRGVVTQSALEKTEIFAADETGGSIEIIPGFGLLPLRRYPLLSHEQALADIGYDAVESEEP
jgi:hypothetical protein